MKIGIIGAGVMGLTLAYRLSQAGHKVVVLEAAPQIGGLSTWLNYGEFTWDKYYHVILRSDSYLLNLIEELGLSESLVWKPSKTGFLWKGKLVSMSNYWEFLTFPALNLYHKGRLGTGILYSYYCNDPSLKEMVTAEEWLKKVFGKKVYEAIWEPLLESKFGTLKRKVPATIIWRLINRYYSTRDTGGGREWMGHLYGSGLKSLFDVLEQKIQQQSGELHCGVKVEAIDDRSLDLISVNTNYGIFEFDRVISTIPRAHLRKVAPQLQGIFSQTLLPHFLGVIRLALVLRDSLSPFYVTNLIDKGLPFTGIIEISTITEPDEMAGRKLVMIPRYDVPESEWFVKTDEEIYKAFIEKLKLTWPDIESNIMRSYVHREKVVQALWIDTPPPNPTPPKTQDRRIWSVNAELAGRDVLNNNAIVRVANEVSKEFSDSI